MPRNYRLGERTAQMWATRDRIIEAAIELYAEVGVSRSTMRQVGLRADVAPGTLRNHFPSRRALDDAVVERLTAEAPLPDAAIFAGAGSIEDRVERFVHATGTFFDQAARLYEIWLREPMLTSPWTEAGATYGARWAELQRLALGPLADDEDVRALLRAVIDPPFFDAIRGGTRTTEQVCALITEVLRPWLASRSSTVAKRARLGMASPGSGD